MSCKNPSSSAADHVADSLNKKVVTTPSAIVTDGSFEADLDFLKSKDPSLVVLKSADGEAQVIVSSKYQAKVFTSTAAGLKGPSFGWVNYKAFSGPEDKHMNAYGGENRFWLGPEGGPFSLFFPKEAKMTFDNWKTPAAFDTEPWTLAGQKNMQSVTMQKQMRLTNYKGSVLDLSIERQVQLLTKEQINQITGIRLSGPGAVKAVAYKTINLLTNAGSTAIDENTGVPCMWILDMFRPTASTVIVVPFTPTPASQFKEVATTDYFGSIPDGRLKHNDHVLFFKADGKMRGKLGVVPTKAKDWIGSYDFDAHVLTLLHFDLDPKAKYLNQEWKPDIQPYANGDAVNAYNDGPLEDGSQMGPFYELESVSPAAFLASGQQMTHSQSVFHFTGTPGQLDLISQKLLGVTLGEIRGAFTDR